MLSVSLLAVINNANCADIDDFVITIQTDNAGTSAPTAFAIPTRIGFIYNYNVDCNDDGTPEATGVTGPFTCDYSGVNGAGTYTIRIKDNSGSKTGFPTWRFSNGFDKLKLLSIDQWGTGIWQSMNGAFYGASNMQVLATDNPNFTQVSDMLNMFNRATLANPNTQFWDLSSVTSIGGMFKDATNAQPDTSLWDTSMVSNFSFVFSGATLANPVTNGWVTTSATSMKEMFKNARNAAPNTSTWNTANVTNMRGMFQGASIATPDTSIWNTAKVTDMANMFNGASIATPNTNGWDTALVTDMSFMFNSTALANPNVTNWNTTKVTSMISMFGNTLKAKPNTALWDTGMVTDMSSMFSNALLANPNTSSWNTSMVTSMNSMFINAVNASPDVTQWDITQVGNFVNIFQGVTLPTIDYDALLIAFNNQNVQQGLTFSGGNSTFCSPEAKIAHEELENNHGWTIFDGGLCLNFVDVPNEFVITVQSDNPGVSLNTEFTIPTIGAGYNYNVDSNNDGTDEVTGQTSDYTCDFSTLGGAGTYQISISDNVGDRTGFPRIYFNDAGDKLKITAVNQWGTGIWTDMSNAFHGAANLTLPAFDEPNFKLVTNMSQMLAGVSLPSADYDALLIVMYNQNHQANIAFDGGGSQFCNKAAENARTNLMINSIWAITDGGACTATDPANDFVFTIASDNPGTLSDTQFMIDTVALDYNYNVDCNNDGVDEATGVTGTFLCDYAATGAGNYTIRIKDNSGNGSGYYQIKFDIANRLKVTSIDQWGTMKWTSMRAAIALPNATLPARDVPDLTLVSDLAGMFASTTLANPKTTNWDVSHVTDMSGIFQQAEAANPNTTLWDTSSVILMNNMFDRALIASPNTKNWNTSQVTNMRDMFAGAMSASPNTTNWNTSNVTSMSRMFSGASAARPNTSNWNMSNVQSIDDMFRLALLANPDTSLWDTSSITDLSGAFLGASMANPDVSNWDTSMVVNMSGIFSFTDNANPDVSQWTTSTVTNMSSMFLATLVASPDTSLWDTGNVISFTAMFQDSILANPDTSSWNVSNALFMSNMFNSATSANPDTSTWTTTNVINMSHMFENALLAQPDTSSWDITQVTSMTDMFKNVTLPESVYDAILISFAGQNVQNGVKFSGGLSQFCNAGAQSARTTLINNFNWDITDGGYCLPVNTPPTFDIACELDATDVTGPGGDLLLYENYVSNVVVGPASEIGQSYTISAAIVANGDPKSIVTEVNITQNGFLNLRVDTTKNGVATLAITVQDDGGAVNGGQDTSIVQFNVHHYADLDLDPNFMHLIPGDIIYKNTYDPCRL